jgi:hypothetical protein
VLLPGIGRRSRRGLSERNERMAQQIEHAVATDELRERQEELIGLELDMFCEWCDRVARMEVDPVRGVLQRLTTIGMASDLFQIDRRITLLQRAEEMVVDQLDAEELIERQAAGCLTLHMCEYWLAVRPKEVPTVNGYPVWLAGTLADVAG